MKKRFLIAALILLVIFGGTFAWLGIKTVMMKRFFANFHPPAVSVSTSKAHRQEWRHHLASVGSLKAINSVEVNAEVAGQVKRILFQSGQSVKQGQVLLILDDAVDEQHLKTAQAALALDTATYQRQRILFKQHATAKSALDAAHAKMLQSEAAVTQARVMIQKKIIRAPFSGRLGIRQVNIGSYVAPGQGLVPLQSQDPLYVDFSIPEQHVGELKTDQIVRIQTDAYPNRQIVGRVVALNSGVSESTRSLSVRAAIPNHGHELTPGLFAEVSLELPSQQTVITIPQTAITYSMHGDSVYQVVWTKEKGDKMHLIAKQRFVKLGERRGDLVQVLSGLNDKDIVVTAGALKLHPNAEVVINNSVKLNA